MKGNIPIDLHVHSDFSCCPATMQEITWEAKLKGLRTIGFSDHYDKIIDNSSFEKYYQDLSNISKINYLTIKKSVEFELKNFDELLKDLKKIKYNLDYIFFHNLKDFEELKLVPHMAKKLPIPILVAHPEVGYWNTNNIEIVEFIKKNSIIVEANKTHFSMLKEKPLEKEIDFFDKLLKEKKIKLTFGSDYHEYNAFNKKNSLYDHIWKKIEKNRIYLIESTKNKLNNSMPNATEWIQIMKIKKTNKKIKYSNKPPAQNEIIQKKINLIKTQNSKTLKIPEIIRYISPKNNTGLNMFYFKIIEEIAKDNCPEVKKILDLLAKNFLNSKVKDIRRYTYKTIFCITKNNLELNDEALNYFNLALRFEQSVSLKKLLFKYIKQLNIGD